MKKSIYIFSNGNLQRKDNTIRFYSDEKKQFIPIQNVSEIYVFGEVDITKKFLELLSQEEILLHYFNYYGYYMGSFYPREHYNSGYMILRQASFYEDPNKRLGLATKFVTGAVKNILQVVKYYQKNKASLAEERLKIEEIEKEMPQTLDIETLMSKEAHIREIYYRCFDEIIGNEDFYFEKRTRRPPKNFLNAMISFGNSVMYTLVLSEIYHTYLDPRIGYLHATNFRRFSLNLDVAEIFKPVIIDRTIFTLINKRIITKKDFEKDLNGILLSESGKKKFMKALEERLVQTISIKNVSNKVSYKRLIRLELYKLQKHFMGEKEYSPYISRW